MKSKRRQLGNSKLYLVLDRGSLKSRDPVDIARKALSGGADIIQLRDKFSSAKNILSYGRRIKKIARQKKALFIINDRLDICSLLDADGVHLGQDDISVREARKILGKEKIIGISCHSVKEILGAAGAGADYIAVGPIFKSPTKPELRPRGTRLLAGVAKKVKKPIVGIGGINEQNVARVIKSGADIIAVVSAILGRRNIEKAVRDLKGLIIGIKKHIKHNDSTGKREEK